MSKQPVETGVVVQEEQIVPAWIAALRGVANRVVKPEDLEEIVRAQLIRAKQGDRHAIDFVFRQLAASACPKGATFIQNNYSVPDGIRPDAPAKAAPGTRGKVEMMRRRVQSGLPPTNPKDAAADLE